MGGTIGSPSTAYVYDWNMRCCRPGAGLKELENLFCVPAAAGSGDLRPHQVYNQMQAGARLGRSGQDRAH